MGNHTILNSSSTLMIPIYTSQPRKDPSWKLTSLMTRWMQSPRPMSWIRGNWIHWWRMTRMTAWWFHSVRPTSFSEPEMCLTIWTCMGLQPCWLNTVLRWILPAIGRLGCLLPADPSRKKLIRTTRLIHPTLTANTRFLSMLLMVMSALLNPRSRSMPWFRGRPITIWWKFVWLWAPITLVTAPPKTPPLPYFMLHNRLATSTICMPFQLWEIRLQH